MCNQFLAKGMLAAGIPANALDCQPFREALMAVAEFGPGFKPMGRKQYYAYYCPRVKAELVEDLKKYEEVLELYGCTVCTDGWKAVDNKKLMNGEWRPDQAALYMASKRPRTEAAREPARGGAKVTRRCERERRRGDG